MTKMVDVQKFNLHLHMYFMDYNSRIRILNGPFTLQKDKLNVSTIKITVKFHV